MNNTMRAVICPAYGPPEIVRIENIPVPLPKSNEILIRIKSSAVNSGDVRVRGLAVTGFMKLIMRVVLGFSGPRRKVLGTVYAGVIEKTGNNVSMFRKGEEVFGLTGMRFGGHAEYIAVSENSVVVTKPSNASFEEAAAIPFGVQTAIYFLQKAKIDTLASPRVLIYGATGAVGTAAIQIAKHYHAHVTAVCSASGRDLVKSLGADDVILYTKEDFTKSKDRFDIIFDAVGKTLAKQCRHLLAPNGIYKTVGGMEVAAEKREQLLLAKSLFENGKYNAVIDKVYPLTDIVEAHRYVDSGRKKGNVVIDIS